MNNVLDDESTLPNECPPDGAGTPSPEVAPVETEGATVATSDEPSEGSTTVVENVEPSTAEPPEEVEGVQDGGEVAESQESDEPTKPKKSLKLAYTKVSSFVDTLVVDVLERNRYMDTFVRLFASYFIMCLYNLTRSTEEFDTIYFPRSIDVGYFVGHIASVFVMLTLAKYIVKNLKLSVNTDGYFLGASITLYGLTTVVRHMNVYYAFGVSLVVSICLVFLLGKGYFKEFATLTKLQSKVIVGVFSVSATVFIATFCIYRYLIYASSCFDLGIFCQMYYYLVHTLLPNTTCERNELLSHFAVHVSPIYYLLVPVYAIFQSPKTLLVCQAIIVESGVVPLYMLCKRFKFSNAVTMAMCVVYTFSPAYITACFFDFHENKFLVPLVLWILWAMETGHIKWMYVFTVLTLFVKEDAFIYVVCISLFMVTSNRKYFDRKAQKERSLRWHGILITAVGLFYFAVVTMLMDRYGLGIMQYHYNNIMMDSDQGILNVVLTSALDPALAISECFKEEKFIFFLEMVGPLLFLPFASKKVSHVFLLIPFFLVNLISGNGYQNQLGYQYVCGVMSLLIYASILNLSEMETTPKKYAVTASMCISMVLGTMFASDKVGYYDTYCNDGYRLNCIDSIVSLIPEDASVESTTYYVPQLSQRMELYMMEDPEDIDYPETDFVLIRPTEDYFDEREEQMLSDGYEFYDGYEDYVYLYVKTSYLEQHPDLLDAQRETPRQNY
jgi:uncharacterized membrane protein